MSEYRMTETDTFSSRPTEKPHAPSQVEKKSLDSAAAPSDRSKLSGASFLKAPSEPDETKSPEAKKTPSDDVAAGKTEKEIEEEKIEKERLKIEAERAKAREKAEAEARRELTAVQVQAKTPKTEKEMLDELEMLTSTKILTPSQIGSVLQWLIKQEILQSERIKHLQKEIEILLKNK